MTSESEILSRLETLNAIGVALSHERDLATLLERILEAARDFADADGGTLYLVEGDHLRFEVLRNDSLGYFMGGRHGKPIQFPPIPLFREDGSGNDSMVVVHSALSGKTINIADAYTAEGYDFSGTRAFDAKTGYRSQSFLTVPMKDHDGKVIGVLQLINSRNAAGAVDAFSQAEQPVKADLLIHYGGSEQRLPVTLSNGINYVALPAFALNGGEWRAELVQDGKTVDALAVNLALSGNGWQVTQSQSLDAASGDTALNVPSDARDIRLRLDDSPQALFDEYKYLTEHRDLDLCGLSYALLDAQGPQQWPLREGDKTGQQRLYADGVPADEGASAVTLRSLLMIFG